MLAKQQSDLLAAQLHAQQLQNAQILAQQQHRPSPVAPRQSTVVNTTVVVQQPVHVYQPVRHRQPQPRGGGFWRSIQSIGGLLVVSGFAAIIGAVMMGAAAWGAFGILGIVLGFPLYLLGRFFAWISRG